MSSVPALQNESENQKDLPVAPNLEAIEGAAEKQEISDPLTDLRNAKSRKEGKEIMDALVADGILELGEKGRYKSTKKDKAVAKEAISLYKSILSTPEAKLSSKSDQAQASVVRANVTTLVNPNSAANQDYAPVEAKIYKNLRNAKTREEAKAIMEGLVKDKILIKNEKGFYVPEEHTAVTLYRQTLTHFTKQEKAKAAPLKPEANDKAGQAKNSLAQAKDLKAVFDVVKPLVGTLLDYDQNKKIVAVEGNATSADVFKAFNEALARLKKKPAGPKEAPQAKKPEEAKKESRRPAETQRPTPLAITLSNGKTYQDRNAFVNTYNALKKTDPSKAESFQAEYKKLLMEKIDSIRKEAQSATDRVRKAMKIRRKPENTEGKLGVRDMLQSFEDRGILILNKKEDGTFRGETPSRRRQPTDPRPHAGQ